MFGEGREERLAVAETNHKSNFIDRVALIMDALFGLLFKWKQDTQFLQPDYLSRAYQNSQKRQNRKREKQLFICTQQAWWSENRGRLEDMNLALSHQQSMNQFF